MGPTYGIVCLRHGPLSLGLRHGASHLALGAGHVDEVEGSQAFGCEACTLRGQREVRVGREKVGLEALERVEGDRPILGGKNGLCQPAMTSASHSSAKCRRFGR